MPGQFRDRFANRPLLCATVPSAELALDFEGTAVGAYLLADPDAGTVLAEIDGGEPRTIELSHRYSRNLHYPRTVLFGTDLAAGRHTRRLRVNAMHSSDITRHAVRVVDFVANRCQAGRYRGIQCNDATACLGRGTLPSKAATAHAVALPRRIIRNNLRARRASPPFDQKHSISAGLFLQLS